METVLNCLLSNSKTKFFLTVWSLPGCERDKLGHFILKKISSLNPKIKIKYITISKPKNAVQTSLPINAVNISFLDLYSYAKAHDDAIFDVLKKEMEQSMEDVVVVNSISTLFNIYDFKKVKKLLSFFEKTNKLYILLFTEWPYERRIKKYVWKLSDVVFFIKSEDQPVKIKEKVMVRKKSLDDVFYIASLEDKLLVKRPRIILVSSGKIQTKKFETVTRDEFHKIKNIIENKQELVDLFFLFPDEEFIEKILKTFSNYIGKSLWITILDKKDWLDPNVFSVKIKTKKKKVIEYVIEKVIKK